MKTKMLNYYLGVVMGIGALLVYHGPRAGTPVAYIATGFLAGVSLMMIGTTFVLSSAFDKIRSREMLK